MPILSRKYVYEGSRGEFSDGSYDAFLTLSDRLNGEWWGRCRRGIDRRFWICAAHHSQATGVGRTLDDAMDDALHDHKE